MNILRDMIDRHAKFEEGEFFEKAKDILSKEQAESLGRQYADFQRKQLRTAAR